jgi:hypothetical protein
VDASWRKHLREPIRLADGRLLLNLADVRRLVFEIASKVSDDQQVRTLVQLMISAHADPTHRNMRALQDVLLVTLEAKALA